MNTLARRSTFCNRLRERTLDLFDWIDFRPDANLWPLLLVPLLLLAFGLLTDFSGTSLILFIGLILTAAVALLTGLLAAAWIVGNSLADVVLFALHNRRARRGSTTRRHGRASRVRPVLGR